MTHWEGAFALPSLCPPKKTEQRDSRGMKTDLFSEWYAMYKKYSPALTERGSIDMFVLDTVYSFRSSSADRQYSGAVMKIVSMHSRVFARRENAPSCLHHWTST